jgi:hypothetical protein
MSVGQPPAATPHVAPAPVKPLDRNEITIVSHSNLFYWWPVWAAGFLFALLTAIDGHRMAIVPAGTGVKKNVAIPGEEGNRDVYFLPKDKALKPGDPRDANSLPNPPRLHIAQSKSFGVLWAVILLLVIVITNVPLRGMWSVLVIVGVITLSLIFHLAGWWEAILRNLSYLDIRINMGGYLFISIGLLAAWVITLYFFDRQIYLTFTPGQLKVCTEIGGGEKVYDAVGMTLEKQRGDIFRHRILGLGSGDLLVRTSGAQAHQFDLPNVLFINKKVQQIEEMLKKKIVESK